MSRVLITGCSTGIGRGRRGGAHQAGPRRRRDRPPARDPRRPRRRGPARLDVDDPESVRAAVAAAGPVDALVNNAGFGIGGPVETVDLDDGAPLHGDEPVRRGPDDPGRAARPARPRRRHDRERGVGGRAGRRSPSRRSTRRRSGRSKGSPRRCTSRSATSASGSASSSRARSTPASAPTSSPHRSPPPTTSSTRRGPRRGAASTAAPRSTRARSRVAAVIADAIESTEARLRWPVGDDADARHRRPATRCRSRTSRRPCGGAGPHVVTPLVDDTPASVARPSTPIPTTPRSPPAGPSPAGRRPGHRCGC